MSDWSGERIHEEADELLHWFTSRGIQLAYAVPIFGIMLVKWGTACNATPDEVEGIRRMLDKAVARIGIGTGETQ